MIINSPKVEFSLIFKTVKCSCHTVATKQTKQPFAIRLDRSDLVYVLKFRYNFNSLFQDALKIFLVLHILHSPDKNNRYSGLIGTFFVNPNKGFCQHDIDK